MKQFQTLEEFVHSDAFSKKDLYDCDLSNLDLSSFPTSTWEGFTFYETNFTNTNIKFYPQTLKWNGFVWDLDYCNFSLEDKKLYNECLIALNNTISNKKIQVLKIVNTIFNM